MDVKSGVDLTISVCNSIHWACSLVRNAFCDFFYAISKLKEIIAVNRLIEKKLPKKMNTAKNNEKYLLLFLTGPASLASMKCQK